MQGKVTWYSFFHSSTALSKIFGEKASLEDLDDTFGGAKAVADARERRRTAAIMTARGGGSLMDEVLRP